MLVLGMNLGHDGAVALVKDGLLIGAIAKERLTRVKKDTGVTVEMVNYVLSMVGAKLSDVDAVGFAGYDYHPDNEVKIFHPDTGVELAHNFYDMAYFKGAETCNVSIGGASGQIKKGYYVQHHLAHCASTYFTSPFEKAACFSLDASGRDAPEASSTFAIGQGQQLIPFYCPGLMIGNEYSELTARVGLGPGLYKAGSFMGLAAYGKRLSQTQDIIEACRLPWYQRGGQPSEQAFFERLWVKLTGHSGQLPMKGFEPEESDKQAAMDIAATFQHVFEEVIVEYVNTLYYETKGLHDDNICLSGGSFLNCNVNTRILQDTPFKRVHLFPGCGDDGTAVGTALFLSNYLANDARRTYSPAQLAYLGKSYTTPTSVMYASQEYDVHTVAKRIADGHVVAWFQGRSEFGPRALGNRSILGDPRNDILRDHINKSVKHREWFRPFAPSVLEHKAGFWFDFPGASPFMLHTSKVKDPKRIPAVTHVDDTARHQTVNRRDNERYYDLIASFDYITGVPMLLNTSLNNNNEPLVETPDDLLRFWQKTPEVSTLVLNDRMMLR